MSFSKSSSLDEGNQASSVRKNEFGYRPRRDDRFPQRKPKMARGAVEAPFLGKPRDSADLQAMAQYVTPRDRSDDHGSTEDDLSGSASSHVSSSPLARVPTKEQEFSAYPEFSWSSRAPQLTQGYSATTYQDSLTQSFGSDQSRLHSVVRSYETEPTPTQLVPEYFTEEWLAQEARRAASFPSHASRTEPEFNSIYSTNFQNHGSRSLSNHLAVRVFPKPRGRSRKFQGRTRALCKLFRAGTCYFGPYCSYLHPGINGPI